MLISPKRSLHCFSLAVSALLLFAPWHAAANDCNPSLFQAYTAENVSDEKRLFFLRLVDRENYEQMKSSIGGSIGVPKTPLKATVNFDDFSERRRKEYEETNFQFDSDYARDYLATDISANGLQAYLACLRGRSGLAAWIEPGTSTSQLVSIRVSWLPSAHYQGSRTLDINYVGVAQGHPASDSFELIDGGERTITVTRDPGQEFRATLNVDNAFSAVVAMPVPPKMSSREVKREITKTGTIHTTSTEAPKHEYPCLEAPAGWELDISTVQISPSVPNVPRPWGYTQHSVDSKRACFDIWLSRFSYDPDTVNWSITARVKRTIQQFD